MAAVCFRLRIGHKTSRPAAITQYNHRFDLVMIITLQRFRLNGYRERVTTTGTLLSAFESRTQYSSMASGGNGETLSDATRAILKCAETIPALYQLQETNTSFKNLRSACFYEVMLY